ncbi:MAG: hypothetical protein WEE64_11060 [Dehalococcoidia bacterium]
MSETRLDTILARYDDHLSYWSTLPEEEHPNDLAPWVEDKDWDRPFWFRLVPAGVEIPDNALGSLALKAVETGTIDRFKRDWANLLPLQEEAREARAEKRDVSWGFARRSAVMLELAADPFFQALGGEFSEDDWRSWALVAANVSFWPEAAERLYARAISLHDCAELRCDRASCLLELGLVDQALAECTAGRRARPGVLVLRIGDELAHRGQTAPGTRAYELAAELAPNPKLQLEIGCLLLGRAHVPHLPWVYPFFEAENVDSVLADGFLPNAPPIGLGAIGRLALTAIGRAHRLFAGFSSGDWSGTHLGSDADIWDDIAVRALGITFAALNDHQGVAAAWEDLVTRGWGADELQEQLMEPSLWQPIEASLSVSDDTAIDPAASLKEIVGEDWLFLSGETKRHLEAAERHFRDARRGELVGDDAIIRYTRAFEAQVEETIAQLTAGRGVKRKERQSSFEALMHWQKDSFPLVKADVVRRLAEQQLDHWLDFLLIDLPQLWNGRPPQYRGMGFFRQRFAAHGRPSGTPARPRNEVEPVRRALLEQEENVPSTMQRLGRLASEIARRRGITRE